MDELKQQLRIDKITVALKRKMLDFPVLSWSDVKRLFFPRYTESEINQAIDRLRIEGFLTTATGSHGGVRYVRSLTKE